MTNAADSTEAHVFASGARKRLIAKIEAIAARSEEYDGGQSDPAATTTRGTADYRRSLDAAEAKAANLQEQLDALLKLNALLEQRLAAEVPA